MAQHAKKNVVIFNYAGDNRYSSNENIATHNGQFMSAKKVATLSNQTIKDYDVIGVDELHLFPDYEVVDEWAQCGKIVEVALLNSGISRSSIAAFTYVASRATDISFFKSICDKCYQTATFSTRTTPIQNTLIGGSLDYSPRCITCWNLQ